MAGGEVIPPTSTDRLPTFGGFRQRLFRQLGDEIADKRAAVTHEKAFAAYDELLDEACSVLAIQHARIVDLEQRVDDLEGRKSR